MAEPSSSRANSHLQKLRADHRANYKKQIEAEVAAMPALTEEQLADAKRSKEEKAHLIEDLDSGAYILTLERNISSSAKCRATYCKIQTDALVQQQSDKICGAFRFDLAIIDPATDEPWSSKRAPYHRYYHITCFQNIGVDIDKYLEPPVYHQITVWPDFNYTVDYPGIHHAVYDWVMLDGKTFNIESYNGKFKQALEAYDGRWNEWLRKHMAHLELEEPCSCDPEPEMPKSQDLIEAEPFERRITEVLLDVMGAGHLITGPDDRVKVNVLDVWGYVPGFLSEANEITQAREKTKAKQMGTISADGASFGGSVHQNIA